MGYSTTRNVNKEVEARLKKLAAKKHSVKVGIIAGKEDTKRKDKGGINNAMLAQIHEFGAPSVGIPERSFMRGTARVKQAEILKEQALLMKSFMKGKITLEKALDILGLSIAAKIKLFMREGIAPELTEARKKQKVRGGKAGDTPLIDTGQLINSISHEVEK